MRALTSFLFLYHLPFPHFLFPPLCVFAPLRETPLVISRDVGFTSHSDRRTIGDEGRDGPRGKGLDEQLAVERQHVGVQIALRAGPDPPGRMLDLVLARPAAPGRVAPVVLGNELLVGTGHQAVAVGRGPRRPATPTCRRAASDIRRGSTKRCARCNGPSAARCTARHRAGGRRRRSRGGAPTRPRRPLPAANRRPGHHVPMVGGGRKSGG